MTLIQLALLIAATPFILLHIRKAWSPLVDQRHLDALATLQFYAPASELQIYHALRQVMAECKAIRRHDIRLRARKMLATFLDASTDVIEDLEDIDELEIDAEGEAANAISQQSSTLVYSTAQKLSLLLAVDGEHGCYGRRIQRA